MSIETIYLFLDDINIMEETLSISSLHPNPFNPSISLDFNINVADNIKIQIIDINGKVVEILSNSNYYPGSYSISWDAVGYSSGIYFIQILSSDNFISEKITLIK